MNEIIEFRLSELALLKVLSFGVALLFIFRFLHRILDALLRLRDFFAPLSRVLPVIEAVLWLTYIVWAVGVVFTEGLYYNMALLMVLAIALALVSWFAARDWIAGLILRVQDAYETGQKIRFGEIEGTIRQVSHLALEIELSDGEQAKIPYSRISGQIRSQIRPDTTSNYHHFEIEIANKIPLAEAKQILRTAIMNSPWTAFEQEPQIKLLTETPTHYSFEVVVYTTGAGGGQTIEYQVKEQCATRTTTGGITPN